MNRPSGRPTKIPGEVPRPTFRGEPDRLLLTEHGDAVVVVSQNAAVVGESELAVVDRDTIAASGHFGPQMRGEGRCRPRLEQSRRPGKTARGDRRRAGRRPSLAVLPLRRSDDAGCPEDRPLALADGALRTLGFDGDFAKLRKLTTMRLGADTVHA